MIRQKELEHPFYANPQKWIAENCAALRACFGKPSIHTCVDEAVQPRDGKFATYSVGAGDLHPNQEGLAKNLKEMGVEEVDPHVDCGGNKIFAQKNNLSGDPDAEGLKWAEGFVKQLGPNASVHQITESELQRPPAFHPALAAVFYGHRAGFNRNLGNLPLVFKMTDALADEQYALEQLLQIGTIAWEHGHGDQMDKFHFVALGNGRDVPAKRLEERAWLAAHELNKRVQKKVFNVVAGNVEC